MREKVPSCSLGQARSLDLTRPCLSLLCMTCSEGAERYIAERRRAPRSQSLSFNAVLVNAGGAPDACFPILTQVCCLGLCGTGSRHLLGTWAASSSKAMRLVTYNVNGLRALLEHHDETLASLLERLKADIVCVQETKLSGADMKNMDKLAVAAGWYESMVALPVACEAMPALAHPKSGRVRSTHT